MYNNTNPFLAALTVLALLVVLVGGALFINERVSAKCFDWWPFGGKTCVVGTR